MVLPRKIPILSKQESVIFTRTEKERERKLVVLEQDSIFR